jgi:hypothetical protein
VRNLTRNVYMDMVVILSAESNPQFGCNVDMDTEVVLSAKSNPQCGYGYGGYIECGI